MYFYFLVVGCKVQAGVKCLERKLRRMHIRHRNRTAAVLPDSGPVAFHRKLQTFNATRIAPVWLLNRIEYSTFYLLQLIPYFLIYPVCDDSNRIAITIK